MKSIIPIVSIVLFMSACSESTRPIAKSENRSSEITLFLTSSGMQVSSRLIPLLPFEPAGRTICFITTASHPEGVVPPSVLGEIEALEKLGFDVNSIDLSILEDGDLEQVFSKCDLFWVCGGNTLYLLQEVRRSGFDHYVKRKISEGIPYVGVSAGSILLGPDVEFERYACDTAQAPNLTSFEGLNLFPFATYVHFDAVWAKDVYKEILDFSLEESKSFITLHDNQFIYVKGERRQVIDVD